MGYADLQRLGDQGGIDIGFYMFSGANWYPMLYDYPPEMKRTLTQRRRRALLRGLIQRVKLTRPNIVVPAAGPCTVLDPDLLWLNSPDDGIFIDPEEAVAAVNAAGVGAMAVNMAATDVWDPNQGIVRCAPAEFRRPRAEYIRDASERLAPQIRAARAAEPAAGADLARHVARYFDEHVGGLPPALRRRIGARLAIAARGPQQGEWTVDFNAPGPSFVRDGIDPDWSYRIDVEDRALYPFVTGAMPFFEDLLLSLRVNLARRPDVYNEPLYHFLYEPDPQKLGAWYATH
jgi:UDP-MurNAc hydroxylase